MPLLKGPALPIDIVELRVPIRMPGPFAGFAQPLHSVVQIFLQDLAHGVGADPVALAAQLVHDVGQAFRDPPQRLHRIPARGRVDNLLDPGPQFRMLGEDGFSASPRATLSASDQIAVWVAGGGWQFALALHDGLATDRQRFGYGPHSSPSKRKRLIRRPQSRSALSQMWLQPLIFFSYDPFPFLPHLPVQPQIFLFAASPIVLGHPWDPPFCRVSQYALPRDRRFVQPNRSVGSYFFKAPKPGSLFPALHRMEEEGWTSSFWGDSENHRRAKYYRLTKAGRKQLEAESRRWGRISWAIAQALEAP